MLSAKPLLIKFSSFSSPSCHAVRRTFLYSLQINKPLAYKEYYLIYREELTVFSLNHGINVITTGFSSLWIAHDYLLFNFQLLIRPKTDKIFNFHTPLLIYPQKPKNVTPPLDIFLFFTFF